jgi:uncharacterized protein with ParB-like and HNH nuclease domain
MQLPWNRCKNVINYDGLSVSFSGLKAPHGLLDFSIGYYLLNSEEKYDLRYKILLTRSDKETFFNIIEHRELPTLFSHHVVENYEFFEEQIQNTQINLTKLYQGIQKLFIVDISLDRNYDNPQLIFESLNSTGLDLSQSDLIRNYILMGLEPKEQERTGRLYRIL